MMPITESISVAAESTLDETSAHPRPIINSSATRRLVRELIFMLSVVDTFQAFTIDSAYTIGFIGIDFPRNTMAKAFVFPLILFRDFSDHILY